MSTILGEADIPVCPPHEAAMATLQHTELSDVTVLKLKGSLTMEGLEEVQEQFQEFTRKPGVHMLVDLTDVDMVTTPALSMFLAAASAVKNSGGRIIFTESRPPVRDILKRLRLHSVLHTIPGYEEALAEARRK
jgi:anti-anti-sigma factor